MYPSDWFLHTEIQRRYLCEHWRHLAAVRRTKEAAAVDELMSEGEPLLLNESLCTEQPAQMVQRKQHRWQADISQAATVPITTPPL